MSDDMEMVCFCTQQRLSVVKQKVREHMKPEDDVAGPLLMQIHKSLAGDEMIGRCCSCLDEIEDVILDYQLGKWS